MNTPFSIRLYSVLLIGALLPFCFFSAVKPIPTSQAVLSSDSLSSDSQVLAFGSGIPEARGGGGTR